MGDGRVSENLWIWMDCLQHPIVGGEVSVVDNDGGVGLRRLRAGENCAVGSWRGARNPFRLPINHPFEGELLGFEGELLALEGEPIALEGGERSNGRRIADTP